MSETKTLPVLPLRDIVVFPHQPVPLFVGREKSVRALEEAMRNDGKDILLLTQKDKDEDDPAPIAIYDVGVVATILQLLKLPDGTVKVLVEGKTRAGVARYTSQSDYYEVEIADLPDDRRNLRRAQPLLHRPENVGVAPPARHDGAGRIEAERGEPRRVGDAMLAHLMSLKAPQHRAPDCRHFTGASIGAAAEPAQERAGKAGRGGKPTGSLSRDLMQATERQPRPG